MTVRTYHCNQCGHVFANDEFAEMRRLNKSDGQVHCDQCELHGEVVPVAELEVAEQSDANAGLPNRPAAQPDSMSAKSNRSASSSRSSKMQRKPSLPESPHASLHIGIHGPDALDEHGSLVIQAKIVANQDIESATAWIEERETGHKGEIVDLDFNSSNQRVWETTEILKIHLGVARSTSLRLVVENDEDPCFQWRGDFAIKASKHIGQIHIDLSDNVNAQGDFIGGLNERKVQVDKEFLQSYLERNGDWGSFFVDRYSKKQLIPRIRKKDSQRNTQLTLSRFDSESQQTRYWQLVGGSQCRIGRKRDEANQYTLRCKKGAFDELKISRFHGMIELRGDHWVYQNVKASVGSTLRFNDKLEIAKGSEQVIELDPHLATSVYPGVASQSLDGCFSLIVRPVSTAEGLDEYLHLAESFKLSQNIEYRNGPRQNLAICRSDDIPEECFVIGNALTVGHSPECGMVLADDAVNSLHALILFIDGSFWIEKWDRDCELAVGDRELRVNEIHVLEPGKKLRIGSLEMAISQSKQHLVDCSCCDRQ